MGVDEAFACNGQRKFIVAIANFAGVAHLSDVSVATTELDVTSLPELAEDDRAGDDGLDLLLGHGVDGRMNRGL